MCRRECDDCLNKFFRLKKCEICGERICRSCYVMGGGRCISCEYDPTVELEYCNECKSPVSEEEKENMCIECGDVYCSVCIEKNRNLYEIEVIQQDGKIKMCYICKRNKRWKDKQCKK